MCYALGCSYLVTLLRGLRNRSSAHSAPLCAYATETVSCNDERYVLSISDVYTLPEQQHPYSRDDEDGIWSSAQSAPLYACAMETVSCNDERYVLSPTCAHYNTLICDDNEDSDGNHSKCPRVKSGPLARATGALMPRD